MAFVDKQLTCRDCNNNFVFTAGEQEFYASKGLQNEPVRCPPCRSSRKTTRMNEPEEGYVKYGVFASFGGRTPRQMHPATCAECGMMTEVPFQPRGDRPVYCSTCYNKVKGAAEVSAAQEAAAAEAEKAFPSAAADETAAEAEPDAPEDAADEATAADGAAAEAASFDADDADEAAAATAATADAEPEKTE